MNLEAKTLIESYVLVAGVNNIVAEAHFKELEKFLTVCVELEGSAAPSKKIDELWHNFILCTEPYMDYCNTHFGKYIHHKPTGRAEVEAYMRTREAVEKRYGALNKDYWPTANQQSSGTYLDNIGTCLDNVGTCLDK